MCHYNDGYYIIYKYLVWKHYDNAMYVVRANFTTILLENTARKQFFLFLVFCCHWWCSYYFETNCSAAHASFKSLCSWDWLRILVPKVLKFLAGGTISRFKLTTVTDSSLCSLGCFLKYFYYLYILQVRVLGLCSCLWTICMLCPQRPDERIESPRTAVNEGCEFLSRCRESNKSPLEQ